MKCYNYRIQGQSEVCKVYARTRAEADGRMHACSLNKRRLKDALLNGTPPKQVAIKFLGVSGTHLPELSLEKTSSMDVKVRPSTKVERVRAKDAKHLGHEVHD